MHGYVSYTDCSECGRFPTPSCRFKHESKEAAENSIMNTVKRKSYWCSIDGKVEYKNCSTCWRSSLSSCRFHHNTKEAAEDSIKGIIKRKQSWCSIDGKVEYKDCSECWRSSLSNCRFYHNTKEAAENSLSKTPKAQKDDRSVNFSGKEPQKKTKVNTGSGTKVLENVFQNLGLSLGISALGALILAAIGPLLYAFGSFVINLILFLFNADILDMDSPQFTFRDYYIHAFLLLLGGTILISLHPENIGTKDNNKYDYIEIFRILIPIVSITAALIMFPGLIIYSLVGVLIIFIALGNR